MERRKRKFDIRLIVGIVIVLEVVGFFTWRYLAQKKISANEFAGTISAVDAAHRTITVSGVFVAADHPELSGKDHLVSATVAVTDQTELVHHFYVRPSREQIAKSHGPYKMDDLQQGTQAGVFEDFAENVTVTVAASQNIYGKSNFEAKKIEYVDMVDTLPVK